MANVFNEAVALATRANGIADDSKPIDLKALSAGSITSPTALAGTNGVNTLLTAGDSWDEIHGNETRHIYNDEKLTVDGNYTGLVNTNYKYTIIGTTTTKYVGVMNQTNVSHRTDTFLQTRLEEHHQPEQKHQPTKLTDIQSEVSSYFQKHTKFSWWFFTMVALKMDVTPILATSFTSMEGKLGVIATKALVMEAQSKALDTKWQAAVTNFTLSAILASAIYAKVIMFDGNAGIAANADSPFA